MDHLNQLATTRGDRVFTQHASGHCEVASRHPGNRRPTKIGAVKGATGLLADAYTNVSSTDRGWSLASNLRLYKHVSRPINRAREVFRASDGLLRRLVATIEAARTGVVDLRHQAHPHRRAQAAVRAIARVGAGCALQHVGGGIKHAAEGTNELILGAVRKSAARSSSAEHTFGEIGACVHGVACDLCRLRHHICNYAGLLLHGFLVFTGRAYCIAQEAHDTLTSASSLCHLFIFFNHRQAATPAVDERRLRVEASRQIASNLLRTRAITRVCIGRHGEEELILLLARQLNFCNVQEERLGRFRQVCIIDLANDSPITRRRLLPNCASRSGTRAQRLHFSVRCVT